MCDSPLTRSQTVALGVLVYLFPILLLLAVLVHVCVKRRQQRRAKQRAEGLSESYSAESLPDFTGLDGAIVEEKAALAEEPVQAQPTQQHEQDNTSLPS
jgi:preprotein translocase subunit YajC